MVSWGKLWRKCNLVYSSNYSGYGSGNTGGNTDYGTDYACSQDFVKQDFSEQNISTAYVTYLSHKLCLFIAFMK